MSAVTSTDSEPLLSVRDLSVEYTLRSSLFGSSRFKLRALDHVTLDVKQGEVVTVIGESGSGKTTLGLACLLLIKPSSGEVYFKGTRLNQLDSKKIKTLRSRMRIVFQDPYSSLDPRMRVGDIIAEPLLTSNPQDKDWVNEQVKQALASVRLDEHAAQKYPHEFSGGQRQRIAIARAIVGNPEFIVLDEPTSSLDVSVQGQILNLLLDLQEKKKLSYLFITHSMSVAKYISDRVCVMYAGRVVELGNVKDLIENPQHPYTVDLINSVPSFDITRKVTDSETKPFWVARPAKGCPYAPRCSRVMEKCKTQEPALMGDIHKVACFLYHPYAVDEKQGNKTEGLTKE
ncbi:MAG: ABC transporter ATP-binding protein [Thermoprotei archaeon]